MALQSKKKLFAALDDLYQFKLDGTNSFSTMGLNHHAIGNETYGDQSFIYIAVGSDKHIRRQLMSLLLQKGFKVSTDYAGNDIEVQVSYFKGNKWIE